MKPKDIALVVLGMAFVAALVFVGMQISALSDGETAVSATEEPERGSGFTLASADLDPTFFDAPPVDENGEEILYRLTIINGAFTFTPVGDVEPDPTPTPGIDPTDEPPTPEPTAVGSLQPCDDHDITEWHGLVSADGSCHYNHAHGDDIYSAAYADYPAWPFEQTISYPHETFEENLRKHEGNHTYGFTTPNDQCVILKDIPGVDGCIVGGRIQYHVVGGARGLTVRFHSFYAQFKIRNDDGSFGYVSTGGHSDFGILHCTYKSAHCLLDSDPDRFNLTQPPYRAARVGVGDGVSQWNTGCHNSTQQPCEFNQIASYDWVTFDDWGGVNPDDLTELLFSGDPERNHSTVRFYEFIVETPHELGNGRINYVGFTDIMGNIDESCAEASADCVPLIIENVDAGLHAFRVEVGTSGRIPMDRYYREFDVSPAGESWIEYPN